MGLFLTLPLRFCLLAAEVVLEADGLASRCPLYAAPRDALLDSILGPPESFEYVSTTSPPSPPPSSLQQ
jgi:hypothetical protein